MIRWFVFFFVKENTTFKKEELTTEHSCFTVTSIKPCSDSSSQLIRMCMNLNSLISFQSSSSLAFQWQQPSQARQRGLPKPALGCSRHVAVSYQMCGRCNHMPTPQGFFPRNTQKLRTGMRMNNFSAAFNTIQSFLLGEQLRAVHVDKAWFPGCCCLSVTSSVTDSSSSWRVVYCKNAAEDIEAPGKCAVSFSVLFVNLSFYDLSVGHGSSTSSLKSTIRCTGYGKKRKIWKLAASRDDFLQMNIHKKGDRWISLPYRSGVSGE